MNAVTAGFCRYGTYSIRHRLHRSVLYGGIDTVDSGVLILIHRNDQTFLTVDDLGVNLSDLFRLDAENDIISFDRRDILAVGILFYATLGMKLLPNHPVSDDDSFGGEQDFSNVPKWKQVLSLVILVLTLLGMIFEKQIGIKLNITGCIGALALILTGVISEKDALKSIDLKTIFLFGGTLSLASALDKTGAGAEIANIDIAALGENPSPYVLTLVVFLLCCVMTNFMSNTATTALMVPICLSIAQGMGADPRAVLMACVIGGSCAYATPIGMPANTMVVSAGGYTFKDYAKAGLPLILIATVVSMVILPIAFPFFPQ